MTVFEAKQYITRNLSPVSDNPLLEVEIILCHVLNIGREHLYLVEDNMIDEVSLQEIQKILQKRLTGYPIFYIIGKKEFFGIEFQIDENVLIPRPETEILVEKALSISGNKKNEVLDIGTGSGCIILSFLYNSSESKGVAVDVSLQALSVAEKNSEKLCLQNRVQFIKGDFREISFDTIFDLILSNPPYVASGRIKALHFEPKSALNGGADGFSLYPEIIKKSYNLLKSGGFLGLEIDDPIKDKVEREMRSAGFKETFSMKDYAGLWRCTFGKKP